MLRITISCFLGFSLILLAVTGSAAQSIYAGGKGDGFSFNNFVQPDNVLLNIYSGGKNDGFSITSFAQPDNVLFAIYSGGIEDGFALKSFAQADNVLFAIYSGGIEDGFALKSFAQADNVLYAIYSGGIQDGFAFNSFAQADNVLYNIYNGGISDGFAFNHLGSIGTEVPLPIVLLSFIGKYQGKVIVLKWITASEINNDHFDLERALNGINFNSLYTVKGAGTTSLPQQYSYTDEKPYPGTNYYRLKQVDFDGHFTYSQVISVNADGQFDRPIFIFPNPSDRTSDIQIVIPGIAGGNPAEVSITSMTGQPVVSFEATVDDFNQIKINQSISTTLASGVYLVSVKLNTGLFTAKLVIL